VVPEDGTIDVAVYAADGRLVRSLASGRATAGVYHVEWNGLGSNGRPVPGGIYYVRGSIGATRVLNRMVRVR
jgi:flagellar hook assembly protein FlgD